MHIVVVHNWQIPEADAAGIIAERLGMILFEARQKIAGGGPAVLANFADPGRAEQLVQELTRAGVPALVLDCDALRKKKQPRPVRRFLLQEQQLVIETPDGETAPISYSSIDLILAASCSSGQIHATKTVTERKFSIGKTLLSGGIPMTSKVKREETTSADLRDESFWLHCRGQEPALFSRSGLSYDGLGAAMQISRDLNFNYLKTALRRHAPLAGYDDRLLKRAVLIRLLGPTLNPETDLDLAVEILARGLKAKPQ